MAVQKLFDTKVLTLLEKRQKKIEEIRQSCNNEIQSGVISSAKGMPKLYGLEYEDQINMEALKNNIALGLIAEGGITYYAKGEPCEPWTNAEFMQLYQDAMVFKTGRITTAKLLIAQAKVATEEELELIVWTPYPTT